MAPPPAPGPGYDHEQWSSGPGPGYNDDPWSPGPVGRPARRALWRGLLAAAVVVLVLGGAGAGWFAFRGHGGQATAGGTGHRHKPAAKVSSPSPASSTPITPTTSPSTAASSSAPPTSAPPSTSAPVSQPPGPAGSTPVALGPAVPHDSASQRLDAFASRYFTAINHHDYQAYIALLGNVKIPTRSEFTAGYGSTSDSAATLTSTVGEGGGDWAIGLSFISHQAASQSKTGTTCTDWQITLYLVPGGASYVEDSPPLGYHPSYQACP